MDIVALTGVERAGETSMTCQRLTHERQKDIYLLFLQTCFATTGELVRTASVHVADHLWSRTQDWARPELSTSVIHVVVSLFAMDAPGLYGDLLTKDGEG